MAQDAEWEEPWASDETNEEDESAIQELLDLGYDQLDGFTLWLEETLELDTRSVQRDCFNAEALVDYLANHQRTSATQANEFELRWFLFSHYIRKAMADPQTEERLPDSLRRFYEYLRVEQAFQPPIWLYGVLDERAFYIYRRAAYAELDSEDERRWEEGFQEWCRELEDDLDTRCLWLPHDLGAGLEWGDLMGWREATLHEEANRNWQQERAALLEDGMDYEAARPRLLQSYYAWTETPQEKLDGQTPREVILGERAQMEDIADEL